MEHAGAWRLAISGLHSERLRHFTSTSNSAASAAWHSRAAFMLALPSGSELRALRLPPKGEPCIQALHRGGDSGTQRLARRKPSFRRMRGEESGEIDVQCGHVCLLVPRRQQPPLAGTAWARKMMGATTSVDELADLLERRLGGVMLVRLELSELLERLKLEEGELTELLRAILQLRDKERAGWSAQLVEARSYARQLETELARLRPSAAGDALGGGLPAADEIERMTGSNSESWGRRLTPVQHGTPSSAAPAYSPLRDASSPLLAAGASRWGRATPHGAHASQERVSALADPAPAMDYEDIAERLAQRLASERYGLECNQSCGGSMPVSMRFSAVAAAETASSLQADSAAREAARSAKREDPEHAHPPSSAVVAADGTTFQFKHLER